MIKLSSEDLGQINNEQKMRYWLNAALDLAGRLSKSNEEKVELEDLVAGLEDLCGVYEHENEVLVAAIEELEEDKEHWLCSYQDQCTQTNHYRGLFYRSLQDTFDAQERYKELEIEYDELAANYNKRYEAMGKELSTNKQTLETVINEKNELWQAITAIGVEFDRYADREYEKQATLEKQLKTSRQLETKFRHEIKVLQNIIDKLQGVEK